MKSCLVLPAFAAALLFCAPHTASADSNQGKVMDILPVITAQEGEQAIADADMTHPILRLTPDKSELVRLDKPAGSIIIGNPLHINIIADSSKTLVIVPRAPGAGYFTVLSKTGEILMQRHVIVASPKDGYLRIKKTCTEDSEGCQKTSVFYCPDMCHEIGLAQDDAKQSSSGQADKKEDNAGGRPQKNAASSETPADE
tara:strand:+ start:4490 stop:5086 length:597 start_codon:yes stop_codon:yes gene_type:complete